MTGVRSEFFQGIKLVSGLTFEQGMVSGSARSLRINASNTLTASVLTFVLHALVLANDSTRI